MNSRRYVWLDLIRGASAIAVCAGHLRNATLRDYAELSAPTPFHTILYFFTGLGHQAVMVFFVLSGFFVGGSILKSAERFKAADYSIARLTRLWTVLIPALVLTFVADKALAHYTPEVLRGANYAIWKSGPQSADSYSASVITFLGNLFFLQTIWTPVFGTNGPLWSLANEFWYYALFPLLAFSLGQCGGLTRRWARAACGAIAAVLWICLPAEIRSGFFIWLTGVAVYLLCCRLPCKKRPLAFLFTLGLFAAALGYSKSTAWQSALRMPADYAVGFGFSTFGAVVAAWPAPLDSFAGNAVGKIAGALSEFSYSLYACHFPLVVVIGALGCHSIKLMPDLKALFLFFAWFGILLSAGGGFWFLFEKRTPFVREFATRQFHRHFK